MLKQIQVRYDPVEDRLLLWIQGGDTEAPTSHALQLTRRVWAACRADMQALIDASAQVPERMDPQARRELSKAHHQAQTSKADVQHNRPLAPANAAAKTSLVTGIRCGRRPADGKWVLSFRFQAQDELSLVLRDSTLHGIVSALVAQEAKTGWGLQPLPMATPAQPITARNELH